MAFLDPDLERLLLGWGGGQPKTWGASPLYEPQTQEPPPTPPISPDRRVIGNPDSLEALVSRVKAEDATSPLPTQDQLGGTPSRQTSLGTEARSQYHAPQPTPDISVGQPSQRPVEADYNIWGEPRAVAEHGFKNRLKQVGRGALAGLQSAQGATSLAEILGRVAGAAGVSAIHPSAAGEMYKQWVVEPREAKEEVYQQGRKLNDAKVAEAQFGVDSIPYKKARQAHEQEMYPYETSNAQYTQKAQAATEPYLEEKTDLDMEKEREQVEAIKHPRPVMSQDRRGRLWKTDARTGESVRVNDDEPDLFPGEDGWVHEGAADGPIHRDNSGKAQSIPKKAAGSTPKNVDILRFGDEVLGPTGDTPEHVAQDTAQGRQGAYVDAQSQMDKDIIQNKPHVIPGYDKTFTDKEAVEAAKNSKALGYGKAELDQIRDSRKLHVPDKSEPYSQTDKEQAQSRVQHAREVDYPKIRKEAEENYKGHRVAAGQRVASLVAGGMEHDAAVQQARKEYKEGTLRGTPVQASGEAQTFYQWLQSKKKMSPQQAAEETKKRHPDWDPEE